MRHARTFLAFLFDLIERFERIPHRQHLRCSGDTLLHRRKISTYSSNLVADGALRKGVAIAAIVGIALAIAPAKADEAAGLDRKPSGSAPQEAPPAAPTLQPSFSSTLKANPDPASIDLGPLGPIYATGVLSGLGLRQDSPVQGDRRDRIDLSNAQIFIQKPDGPVQFFLQSGLYKITSLGASDRNTLDYTRQLFGEVPVGYLKFAPTDAFSIQAGKLPTLIGPESTFSFQNLNIARGLLFNQTNAVNRGVQANYTEGPLSLSISLNDGFYSDRFNWLTAAATYKFDDNNSVTVDGGSNLGRTSRRTFATPLLQNNSSMLNLIYNYSNGPLNVTPYLQYTNVDRDAGLGIAQGASTYAAAVLASYAITTEVSLAGRVEYIAQSGNRDTGTTNLLYGPGSQAVSFTVTPTYQKGVFFARAEYSFVKALDVTPGLAFGRTGEQTSQNRFMLETGIIF